MEKGNSVMNQKRSAQEEAPSTSGESPAKMRKTEATSLLKGVLGTGYGTTLPFRTNPEFLVQLILTKAEQLRVPNNKVFIAERTDRVVDVFKVNLQCNATVPPAIF